MNDPIWLTIARGEIGVAEIPGPKTNPRITEYDACTTLKATSDEVAWCSAFVNWCMKQAGILGTAMANARSWLPWGIKLTDPVVGCVVVFPRGTDPAAGHVGLVAEVADGLIFVLGGNQSDKVCIHTRKISEALGFRWPKGVPLP